MIMSAWGNDMRVYMAVTNNLHSGPWDSVTACSQLIPGRGRCNEVWVAV